ncbi:MAG: hypothetical protein HQ522_03760 [Bacteroidetes bacterium]|nr:hypothetical protein [Bacteroidota bacterium]
MESLNLSNTVNTFDVNKQNQLIKRWAPKVKRALKNSARIFDGGKSTSFVMRKGRMEGKLADSITTRLGKKMGVTELVSFSFERHGVFVHKGVGRGWEINGATVTRTAKGSMSAPRNPAPWFNAVLNIHVPKLADDIAVLNANAALNATKLHIK